MSELRELYQEMILDHGKRPRNFEAMEDADAESEGYNPVCGDRITVFIKSDEEQVSRVTFQGKGCAICTASASMMTEALTGRSLWEVEQKFKNFHDLVTGNSDRDADPDADRERLGKLIVFAGVRDFPVRVKCATLAWHTMLAALERRESVTTE
ncbi:MAG: SUF system NifU family Fe-S cluster assembly protein [bacterium]|nr:SUF system NifU family Fe-S cluster assembly protein [bacterium]